MILSNKHFNKAFLLLITLLNLPVYESAARDYYVTGRVTDPNGSVIPDARISMVAGTTEYAIKTNSEGAYTLRISNIYNNIEGAIEVGVPYPNPFSYSVNIPFIINSAGEIRLSIYSFSGKKVLDAFFDSIDAGSYHVVWDGCNQYGAPVMNGFYFYAITFKGKTLSGKLIKASGFSSYSASTAIEPDMLPPAVMPASGQLRLPVITNVTCNNYYPVRLTDITIGKDTIINFELTLRQEIPFKTSGNHIAMHTGSGYRSLILKGINLGSSPPGYFPGEIAYAITPDEYEEWIKKMAEAGFNSLRVYTLHPPVFYEKLANYNQRHPTKPLLLFQGIWLDEIEDYSDPASFDLINKTTSFTKNIHEVVDCINGNGDIGYRYGKAYGRYLTDVSQWTAGYIIGREIMPQEVDSTDTWHKTLNSYSGTYLDISGAKATEVFCTKMLDLTLRYEDLNYSVRRPVSLSSWPTLDPLNHPTETLSDEDKADYDLAKIILKNPEPGIFATYHAYPYYPNFVSKDPGYRSFSDSEGPDSYLGYIEALKAHYSSMPLIIAEFGVPSSWGSAHQSFSNMNHGGYSEEQQGLKNMRLMHNILDAGCGGGFMFSWMDEWFKPTWIVNYLEAFGMNSGGITIPTRQIWHNLASPEQNFGLITFDQRSTYPLISYQTDAPTGPLKNLGVTSDNSYFSLEIETSRALTGGDTIMIAFDTYLASFGESKLPNGKNLSNRSEFLLNMVLGKDTALYNVTQAYDMNGLTSRYDLANHSVQKFYSTVSDGSPWVLMQWINDGFTHEKQDIGKLPIENSSDFTYGKRSAVAWSGSKIKVRIPWTLLYFRDPTQMKVIDGAETYDGGRSYEILTTTSDGIAVSVYFDRKVTSSTSRYTWPFWIVAPATKARDKKSIEIISDGLSLIPEFND